MEGKGVRVVVIMGVLILGLVVAQTEAKSCCRTNSRRDCFQICRLSVHTPRPVCARICDCIIIEGNRCPDSHPSSSMLENSGLINEYCKLGCASSVCDTITTNQNSDVHDEKLKEAVEHCVNACSELCNKGAGTALASA
ncbi:Thionin [Thalictrum thalictroides]|uniref:Thionin n=1 Tax=Thalictrum thalictroides TaxID=46969 RepID=A0A7J6V1T7_THATH|nr:Thionin [Thalictrum thalictroides]